MSRLIIASLGALALTPGLAFGASNLIGNARFDAGMGGWTPLPGAPASLSWSPQDEAGDAGSGSLRLADIGNFTVNGAASGCFALGPGPVVFGASAYGPGDEPDPVQAARVRILLWNAPNCGGSSLGDFVSNLNHDLNSTTWGPIQGYGDAPAATQSAYLQLEIVVTEEQPPAELYFDNVFVYEGARCAATQTVVCLNDRRFRVDVDWGIAGGVRGQGAIGAFTGDSARSSFFQPSNVELVLKVLDGCAVNQRYWVFAAGLTNVQVVIRVRDTLTGEHWAHVNPLDQAFAPVQDTSAFTGCPH